MSMLFKKNLSQQVAELMEEDIKNGIYKLGNKIPTEPELVEHYGVSRNTLREAIHSLSNAGLLETKQGIGTFVIAKEKLQVNFNSMLQNISLENILEARDFLEKNIVLLAMEHGDEDDIKFIEDNLKKTKTKSGYNITPETDLEFHMAIAQATHNDLLIGIYKYISNYLNTVVIDVMHKHSITEEEIYKLHNSLLQGIKKKNKKKVLSAIESILELSRYD